VCASHCAQLLHTILHRTDLIVFPLTLQTITTSPMMSIWGKGGTEITDKNIVSLLSMSHSVDRFTVQRTHPNTSLQLTLLSSPHTCMYISVSCMWLITVLSRTKLLVTYFTRCCVKCTVWGVRKITESNKHHIRENVKHIQLTHELHLN